MTPRTPSDHERLVHLLGLLRPAPEAWVRRAQEIPLPATALTDAEVGALAERLALDTAFRAAFDEDPVAAAEAAGLDSLAAQLRSELRELINLAERIASDSAYKTELAEDPIHALVSAGVPEETGEPLLRALDVPEEVFAKLPDVAAHRRGRAPIRARLLELLLGSASVGKQLRAAAAG